MSREWSMYIDGKWTEAEDGERLEVVNPATSEVVASAPDGTAADTDAAVAAASRAYESEWADWDARERGDLLRTLARVVEDNFDELVELETRENGKPLGESENDVSACVEALDYYGGAADKHHGDTVPERDGIMDMTVFEPYGVVGVVIPWNWPPMHVVDFLAPVLATGNTAVLKPAPETPLSAIRIAELFAEYLPDGVFNVVTGGVEPGVQLTSHEGVDKLAFTGNSETGKKVLEAAAGNITSAMMELGGKNAAIVFEDADLEAAATGCVEAAFYNTGEACSSAERLLVHESVAEEFVDRFVAATEEYVVIGDGLDPETTMGPLISEAEQCKVEEYVDVAREEGAQLAHAGEVPDDPELADGFFVGPHVFTGVTPDMRLFGEEVFGPVVSVTTFSETGEAVDLANDVRYGLTGGVWTDDGSRAMRVARELDVGTVYVNNFNRDALGVPFGGFKDSGIGRKLAFEETMREFTQVKTIRYGIDADLGL